MCLHVIETLVRAGEHKRIDDIERIVRTLCAMSATMTSKIFVVDLVMNGIVQEMVSIGMTQERMTIAIHINGGVLTVKIGVL